MGWRINGPSSIYAIRCVETERVYVGRSQDLERRLNQHLTDLRGNRKKGDFQKDYNTYGESSFEVYVLEEDVRPEMAQQREAAWIKEYRATDPRFGYNRSDETPRSGFGAVRKGPAPKASGTGSVHEKYRQLSPEHQKVVREMIEMLLKKQEEDTNE